MILRMKNRIYIGDLKESVSTRSTGSGQKEVVIAGWVDGRRARGKMIFFDMRDMTGRVQCVALPSHAEAIEQAKEIRPEWVLKISGVVNKRPDKNVKEGVLNGDAKLKVLNIEIYNKTEPPPIEVTTDGYEIGEEHRLKYRYIDLRRTRMQKNIRYRHKVVKFIRDYLDKENFIEVETPILTKSTPEGARDYIVP